MPTKKTKINENNNIENYDENYNKIKFNNDNNDDDLINSNVKKVKLNDTNESTTKTTTKIKRKNNNNNNKQQKTKVSKLKSKNQINNNNNNTSFNSSSDISSNFKNINENLITPYSKSLFESIEYLSLTWSNLYKLNDLNSLEKNSSFELLRKFHCADCLKAFQKDMNNQANNTNNNLINATNNTLFAIIQDQEQLSEISQDSLQLNLPKNKQSLSRKLAQRRPKQELVDIGILPPTKIPQNYYDQMKNLQKAKLQDYLKTKIEQRPNRESLVQKNILSDSKVAPLLQEHERKLKKARLAVDLNDKLLNRPGPLELVEYGILVSDNSTLNEAIKDGKIVYPKTSELRLRNNRFFIDDQYLDRSLSTEQNDENDSNSSNSVGYPTFNNPVLSPSAATQSSIEFNNNDLTAKTSPQAAMTPNSSNNFADMFKSIPSPTNSLNEQKINSDIADASANIVTNSFLNNYQPSNSSQQNGTTTKPKSTKSKQKGNKSNGGPKKLNQLIFHEYRGPNQKSAVSKTNIAPSTPTNNSQFNLSNNNTNGFNFNDVNNGIKANELNSYKIRLEQQKVYLLYDENVNQKGDQTTPATMATTASSTLTTLTTPLQATCNNNTTVTKQISRCNTQNSLNTQIPILPQPSTNNTNTQIQPQQQQLQIPLQTGTTTTTTNTNAATTSLQLFIPDNLKSLLGSPQILSFIPTVNGTAQVATIANKTGNNCITIQPSPATTNITQQQQPQQTQQQQTQFASILPLTTIQQPTNNDTKIIINPTNDQQFNGNKQNLTLLLPATTTNTGNQTVQQLISSLPSTTSTTTTSTAATTTPSSTTPTSNTNTKPSNIEDMTMPELREECRRRKLHVTGNKQKLIERLKTNMNNPTTAKTPLQQPTQLQIVKSPDSGVGNMEYSPSFSSALGDHSPRSVASTNINVNSRPPSVHNNLNNMTDLQNQNQNTNGSTSLNSSPIINAKVTNGFFNDDQLNEERIKIERQIEELHRKLNLLNSNCKQNNNEILTPNNNLINDSVTVNHVLNNNDNKNVLNNIFIKTESNNDANKDSLMINNNNNFNNNKIKNMNNISNNNNNYYTITATTGTNQTAILNNNLIKTQQIEQQKQAQQSNIRQSTLKQLPKQKPIKILSNPTSTNISSPTTTSITTTNSVTNNNNNDPIKNNSKLRPINSMPAIINNLNGFNNLTKANSSKSLETPQYLIHINIPIIKENNFDNHLTLPITTPNQISPTTTPTTKTLNTNGTTHLNNSTTIPKMNNNTIITQLQQKPLSNLNFISTANQQQQQQLINIIQTNNNNNNNNNSINNQQQSLPSISSLINFNTTSSNSNNNNNHNTNEFLSNNESNDMKLPSIGTLSNKIKLKTEQDNNTNTIDTSLMEWNDTEFYNNSLFYNTNDVTNHDNINHNTTNNNHINNNIETNDEILFSFDTVFENQSTTPESNNTNNNKNNNDLLSVNEFLTTTTQMSTNHQNHDDHILFGIDNDTFFNNTSNNNHQQHIDSEQNKHIINQLGLNNEQQQQQQQQQEFINNLSNQFNLDNIFNDNTYLALQDNNNNLDNNNMNMNMNMNINGNPDNRTTYFDPINITFDLIDNDFVQYNLLESPIV